MRRAARPLRRRWIGGVLATAVVLGGVTIWRFQPQATARGALTPTEIEVRGLESPNAPVSAGDDARAVAQASAGRDPSANLPASDRSAATPSGLAPSEAPASVTPARAVRGVARGTIFVNTLPWARVDLDGVYIGNTPISGRAVAAGEHRLRLTTDEGQVYEVTLNVNPGANTRLVYRF